MTEYRYTRVDVFTDQRMAGNQLAVLPDAAGLDTAAMQAVAREFNLPETAFVFPPEGEGDFRVRIFAPAVEMPFAGHPTIGTAFVLAREGRIPAAEASQTLTRFEENVGIIPVTVEWHGGMPDRIFMDQPIPRHGAQFFNREAVARMLSIDPSGIEHGYPMEAVSSGVPFLYVPVRDLDTMRAIHFRADIWEQVLKGTDGPNVYVFTTETERPDSTVHCRMFAPALGIPEDPATGAASGPLGSYLLKYGIVDDMSRGIISEQGFEMGRPSLISIRVERDGETITRVQVGGKCAPVGSGVLEL